ncbi:unnamed protein product [Phaedon cochleariae]|uniref:Uncharacterized protein n=1 Tax=Phaedon cochleariae TaxID=80249 RepID=A0A9P0DG10_PHACE|nr:unnamed protein product [Phaedon cochleariae]
MFTRILALVSISLLLTETTESAPALASARQFLSGHPGYIPVYIRAGDTPLEDINPDLADAFNSYARRYGRLTYGRSIGDKSGESDGHDEFPDFAEVDAVNLEEDATPEGDNNNIGAPQNPGGSHIQKIPRDLNL